MSRARILLSLVLLLPALLILPARSFGQTPPDWTLSGQVRDSGGLAVPGATVVVANASSGFERVVTTDANGQFTLTALTGQSYRVTATLRGFDAAAGTATRDAARLELLLAAPFLGGVVTDAAGQPAATGILLLAHGGSAAWNDNVRAIAAETDKVRPTEVAFGMATRANIQLAIDRLVVRGATRIVAVPLFVSSHSSVITSTQYLLGLRREMPPDLVRFAKMSHASGGQGDHAAHTAPGEDGTTPVRSPVPVSMTPALDAHPVVAAIVGSRAAAISRDAAKETVLLVAHGPVDDDSNDKWLASLREVAASVKASAGYAAVDAITVRDDAPPVVRDRAAAELRALVEHHAGNTRVLVVPVLLSYGGIEEGLRKRLTNLDYAMATQALAPDARLVTWILDMSATK